jgi:hypothetical protein
MQLQKGPLGILGWFALKVTGRNPPGFGDSVIPVVEVGDNYLATSELQIQRQAVALLLAVNTGATFVVPNGKIWRLIAAGAFGTNNAADNALVSVDQFALQSPLSTVFSVPIVMGNYQTGANGRGCAGTFRPPIFLPSGWTVAWSRNQSAAVTVTANIQVGIVYQEFDL